MKKRSLSLLLSLVLVFSLMWTPDALAESPEELRGDMVCRNWRSPAMLSST